MVRNLETGILLTSLCATYGPSLSIKSVSISPTCDRIAGASLDETVRVWDLESATVTYQLAGDSNSVYSVAFSSDGKRLLSGSLDSNMSDRCALTIAGHSEFVLSVAFSPNDMLLISGSKDRTVQLRDHRQPRMALEISDHDSSVISVAHHPIISVLATGCGDRCARIWKYSRTMQKRSRITVTLAVKPYRFTSSLHSPSERSWRNGERRLCSAVVPQISSMLSACGRGRRDRSAAVFSCSVDHRKALSTRKKCIIMPRIMARPCCHRNWLHSACFDPRLEQVPKLLASRSAIVIPVTSREQVVQNDRQHQK